LSLPPDFPQRLAQRGADDEEDQDRADGRADDGGAAPQQGSEQKAAGQGEKDGAGNADGGRRSVDQNINQQGQQEVFGDKAAQKRLVGAQGLQAQVAARAAGEDCDDGDHQGDQRQVSFHAGRGSRLIDHILVLSALAM